MSAFVVSHDHIDALLSFAHDKRIINDLGYRIDRNKQFTETDIGRILLAENERSVCERYPDTTPGDCPGKIGEESIGYRFRYFQPFLMMAHTKKLIWIIKACDCFDYQACETDDYEQTIAAGIIKAIRARAVRSFVEYESAPWEINRERIKA